MPFERAKVKVMTWVLFARLTRLRAQGQIFTWCSPNCLGHFLAPVRPRGTPRYLASVLGVSSRIVALNVWHRLEALHHV